MSERLKYWLVMPLAMAMALVVLAGDAADYVLECLQDWIDRR